MNISSFVETWILAVGSMVKIKKRNNFTDNGLDLNVRFSIFGDIGTVFLAQRLPVLIFYQTTQHIYIY